MSLDLRPEYIESDELGEINPSKIVLRKKESPRKGRNEPGPRRLKKVGSDPELVVRRS